MLFRLNEFRRSLELNSVIFETNIFVSKCFIISHINVRSILETYVTCGNCLTNTLKSWPKFKLYHGARDKQKYYLKKLCTFLYPRLNFCACHLPYLNNFMEP